MSIEGQRPKRNKKTSIEDTEHTTYPYLLHTLRNDDGQVRTTHPNQVRSGFIYLSSIIDWHSKAVLAWRLGNTMDASLVTSVLKEAISRHGPYEIFNSDQGSQYTGKEHTDILKHYGIAISMNSKGRSIDNIAIERFFRTLKQEEVYVKE